MILRNATIKYKGYDPSDLKPKSTRKVCCSCDICGRVRWLRLQSYRNICRSCNNKSKEQIEKVKKANTGRHHSDETKRKIGLGNKGKSHKHTKETKKKISKSRKGISAPNKGKPMSEEQKKKIRDSRIGRFTGENSPNYNIRR